jgi:hypothetical protein
MSLDPQKNFYDNKRYFQGKDNPGDAHPETTTREPLPRGQLIFGVLFIGFVALLAFLRIQSAREEMQPESPLPTVQATK